MTQRFSSNINNNNNNNNNNNQRTFVALCYNIFLFQYSHGGSHANYLHKLDLPVVRDRILLTCHSLCPSYFLGF